MNLRVFYLTRRGISDGYAEASFSLHSIYFLANAGRGTTERGARRNRTQGETRLNAGGRSLKSSKIAGTKHYFRVFKIILTRT